MREGAVITLGSQVGKLRQGVIKNLDPDHTASRWQAQALCPSWVNHSDCDQLRLVSRPPAFGKFDHLEEWLMLSSTSLPATMMDGRRGRERGHAEQISDRGAKATEQGRAWGTSSPTKAPGQLAIPMHQRRIQALIPPQLYTHTNMNSQWVGHLNKRSKTTHA